MHLAIRENRSQQKTQPFNKDRQPRKPKVNSEQDVPQDEPFQTERDETFNLNVTERKTPGEVEYRTIKKSVINRSCINTLAFCYKYLTTIPSQLSDQSLKLDQIQKLDLSFNTISDIHNIKFDKFTSLKELILNDNKITELPFSEINLCKGLKMINLNNNQLYILPTLLRVSIIEARNNPLRLVTSELVRLSQLELVTFDWMDYLVDSDGSQSQADDNYKINSQLFSKLKKQILQKIDYNRQENMNYCDFHCYFTVKLESRGSKTLADNYLSNLIVKSIYRNDSFFINYLRNFQNQLNYAKMMHHYRMLLETVMQNGDNEILQLFRLKKDNYINVNQEVYFQSLRVCCRYSSYEMFNFLINIKSQKDKIQTNVYLTLLVQEIIQKYDKDKQSEKILCQLIRLYREVSLGIIKVQIPQEYNSRIYKSMSVALLDIYTIPFLKESFQIQTGDSKSSPLFFAMRSKNQELLGEMIQENWDVFEQSPNGHSCKYTYGSTQIGRKMIWKKQKMLIKKHWKQLQNESKLKEYQSIVHLPQEKSRSILKDKNETDDIAEEFDVFNSPSSKSGRVSRKTRNSVDPVKNCAIQDEVLPCLFIRSKEISNCLWKKGYWKKMENVVSFIFYLQRLAQYKDNSLLKRLQLWKKIMERLGFFFDTLEHETPLLQYQIVHVSELLNITREERSSMSVKVEGHRKITGGNSFWCCKNVVYEG